MNDGRIYGDSGGPVFFDGKRTMASVTSFGMNAQCKASTSRTGSTGPRSCPGSSIRTAATTARDR
jgi:secreted trypsin-like serine protease